MAVILAFPRRRQRVPASAGVVSAFHEADGLERARHGFLVGLLGLYVALYALATLLAG